LQFGSGVGLKYFQPIEYQQGALGIDQFGEINAFAVFRAEFLAVGLEPTQRMIKEVM